MLENPNHVTDCPHKFANKIVACIFHPNSKFQVSTLNGFEIMAISPSRNLKTANFTSKNKTKKQNKGALCRDSAK